MNHRIARLVFGFVAGIGITLLAYRCAVTPVTDGARQEQAAAVALARRQLTETLAIGPLQIVDPLAPDRVVGRAYVYPSGNGWEVSGFYRRGPTDLWHPYLVTLDGEGTLVKLKISDTALLPRNAEPLLEVLP